MSARASPRAVYQIAIAVAALLLGVGVYVLARDARASFLPAELHLHSLPPLPPFGALPTFAHTLAFALLTATVLGAGRRNAVAAAAIWAGINVCFEIGQHPAIRPWVDAAASSSGFLDRILAYLANGTFDPADIGAAVLGGAAALAIAEPRWFAPGRRASTVR